jgi:hypothetical protein
MTEQTDTNSASVLNVVIQADCPTQSSGVDKCRNLFQQQIPSQFLLNKDISIKILLINGEIIDFQGQLVSIVAQDNVECEYESSENFREKQLPRTDEIFPNARKTFYFCPFLDQ